MSSGSAPVDIAAKEPPVGHIAQQGMQPSFATELNLNTIEHVGIITYEIVHKSTLLTYYSVSISLGYLWVRQYAMQNTTCCNSQLKLA